MSLMKIISFLFEAIYRMGPTFIIPVLITMFVYKKSEKWGRRVRNAWIVYFIGIFLVAYIQVKTGYGMDEKVEKRVYKGQYKEKIMEKYPNVTPGQKKIVEEFRKQLLGKTRKEEKEDKKMSRLYTTIYDENDRVIYKRQENTLVTKTKKANIKGSVYLYSRQVPYETGYLYNKQGQKIAVIKSYGGRDYRVSSETDKTRYNFVDYDIPNLEIIKIENINETERIETLETINIDFDWYRLNSKKYINNILVSEKEINDEEDKRGFIIATIEKKYNSEGKIIHKKVERKDKMTNEKSVTEIDVEKDLIVTKYYRDQEVFAIVTEKLVGPEELITRTYYHLGEKVTDKYISKTKIIVTRQKIGEPIKIVDIQNFDSKELELGVERFILDENGNLKYKYKGHKGWKERYTYDEATNYKYTMEDSYLHESFYSKGFELDEFYKYIYGVKIIEKYDLKLNKVTNYIPVGDVELKERNIEFGNVKEEKMKIQSTREMKKREIITLGGD